MINSTKDNDQCENSSEFFISLIPNKSRRKVILPHKSRGDRVDLPKIITVEAIESLPQKPFYSFIKRLFDITISLLGIITLGIPMLIMALIIKSTSESSSIFSQERLGKNGKEFKMYKFRSMIPDAEKDGAQWAEVDDERVTKIGRILRKTRIDELPQLINILMGDMSFVGPRPERKIFYDEFEKYIHGFSQRLMVKPGLTGWAQVNGGYDLSPEEKIIYDIYYMKHRSLIMDIKCILKTVAVVFTNDGAR